MFYCFSAFGFTNCQTCKFSNINELSIKKKKGQLSNTIKKSRADRNSRQKTPTSLLHSININKKHTSPKVTYKDQIRKDKEIADN